jgi:hypothetical protein
MSWDETCSRCGNDLLWWRSRSGYRVCMRCCPDPLSALETLARRGPQASCRRCSAGNSTRGERTGGDDVRMVSLG